MQTYHKDVGERSEDSSGLLKNDTKTYELYEKRITVSQEMDAYNNCRLYYENLAVTCANKFIEKYEQYGNMDKFSEDGLKDGFFYIKKAIDQTIQHLVKAKIYDIDEDEFVACYGEYCFSDWIEAFNHINDKYMEIVLKSEELDAYRTLRRQNRGRVIGGGFGLEGAIKGMATAGAINMAAGAVHGIFNLIGKGFSAIGNSLKKSKIYDSEETRNVLWKGLYYSVFNIHYVYCKLFEISGLQDSDLKTANSLFNNLPKMPKEDQLENIVKIIELNPYMSKVYFFAVQQYGDEKNEVQSIAEYFGLGNEVTDCKKRLLQEAFGKLSLETEKDARKARREIEVAMKRLALTGNNDILKKIDNSLEVFDQKARNVDEIIFESREEADIARKEYYKIKEVMEKIDYKQSEAYANECLEQLKSIDFTTAIGKKYLDHVSDVVAQFDQKSRTVDGIEFATKAEAENAQDELDKVNAIFGEIKFKDSEDQAKKCMKRLQKFTFKTAIGPKYIEAVSKVLVDFDLKARTINEIVYNTREEAEAAMKDIQERTVDGVLFKTAEEAREIAKLLPIVKKADKEEKKDFDRLIMVIKEGRQAGANLAVIKPYILGLLDEDKMEEAYTKAKNHQKRRKTNFFVKIFAWLCGFSVCGVIISFFNLIGLGVVLLIYLGYFINRGQEKVIWSFLTDNGRVELE